MPPSAGALELATVVADHVLVSGTPALRSASLPCLSLAPVTDLRTWRGEIGGESSHRLYSVTLFTQRIRRAARYSVLSLNRPHWRPYLWLGRRVGRPGEMPPGGKRQPLAGTLPLRQGELPEAVHLSLGSLGTPRQAVR